MLTSHLFAALPVEIQQKIRGMYGDKYNALEVLYVVGLAIWTNSSQFTTLMRGLGNVPAHDAYFITRSDISFKDEMFALMKLQPPSNLPRVSSFTCGRRPRNGESPDAPGSSGRISGKRVPCPRRDPEKSGCDDPCCTRVLSPWG